MDADLQVFTGTANPLLANQICDDLGVPIGSSTVTTFPNGETRVRIEENVRGLDVFVVQSLCTPVNDHLMQLLILIDALKRASADRITAIIPYFGYARQEKKTAGREPITAKLVANLIQTSGADRIVTMDLHAPAIEGFFDIPVDHLRSAGLLAQQAREYTNQDGLVVGSADAGGVARAEDFGRRVAADDIFVTFKQRVTPEEVRPLSLVGKVEGRIAILVDDIVSTGSSLISASQLLLERGAREIHACAVHADFNSEVTELIEKSTLASLLITDTIPVSLPSHGSGSKIKLCTTSTLFSETIRRIHMHESVSALFS